MTKILYILLGIVLIFTILLIALPSLVSTQWGNKLLLQYLNSRIPGTLEAESIDLSWTGPQVTKNLILKDPSHHFVLSIQKSTADISLLSLLFNKQLSAQQQIEGLNASLIQEPAGSTNLHQALGIKVNPISSGVQHPIQLSNVNADLQFASQTSSFSCKAQGQTRYGDVEGRFMVDASFTDKNPNALTAHIQHFPVALLDHFISVRHPQFAGSIQEILGDSADLSWDEKRTSEGAQFELHATTPVVNATCTGLRDDSGAWTLTAPGKMTLQLTPELWNTVHNIMQRHPVATLQNAVPLELTIDQLHFSPHNIANLHLIAHLNAGDAAIKIKEDSLLLKQSQLTLNAVPSSKEVLVHLQGDLYRSNAMIQPTLNLGIEKQFHNPAIWAKLDIPSFPIAENNIPIQMTVNPFHLSDREFSGQFKSDKVNFAHFNFSLFGDFVVHNLFDRPSYNLICTAQGDVEGTCAFEIDDLLTLTKPADVRLVMTPERFLALRQFFNATDFLELMDRSTISAQIHSLQFPLNRDAPISVVADFDLDALSLQNRQQKIAFTSVKGHVNTPDVTRKVSFQLQGNRKGAKGLYPISAKGDAENFLTSTGRINVGQMKLNLEVRGQQLPVGLFCQTACLEPEVRRKIEAVLGSAIDTEINVRFQNLEGPVLANLKGQNGRIFLDGRLSNGMLTLNKPFEMEVVVTPELGQSILQEAFPILSGVQSAEKPIQIVIQPNQFMFPLKTFDPAFIQISQAVVNLGKMTFSNSGNLAEILSLLRPPAHESLLVWFTPLYFSIDNGRVNIQRMDLLLMDRFPIAIWGKVDLVKDKVDMTVGLSGIALGQALGIRGLDDADMLQLPLKGSSNKVGVDKRRAAARITALMAQSQKNVPGALIGTVLDIAGGRLMENAPPPPTTDPLPWAQQVQNEKKQSSPSPEQKSSKKNPVKKIEEAASSIIDQLFR